MARLMKDERTQRPASTVANAVHVAKLATGEIDGYKGKPRKVKRSKRPKKD